MNGRGRSLVAGAIASLALLLAMPGRARADTDLWPLFQKDDEGTVVMYPFYVHEGKFLMVFPLYYRTNEGKDQHFIWPLVKVSEGRVSRAAPLWFSGDEDEYTLFPIIRQTPAYTFWMTPPMYFAKDGDFKAVFPLYVKTRDHLFIAPTIFKTYKNGELKRFLGVPLFDYKREDDGSKELSVFPVGFKEDELDLHYLVGRRWGGSVSKAYFLPAYYHEQGVGESKLWVLPYYHEKGPDREWRFVPPVFSKGHKHKTDTTYLWTLLYYQRRGPDDRVTSVLPFFWKEQLKDDRTLWAFPYLEEESPNGSQRSVPGLFDKERWRVEETGEITKKLSIASELYLREETRSSGGRLLERNRRFLIFSDERDREGGRTFKLLGIPVMERVEGEPAKKEEEQPAPPLEARGIPNAEIAPNGLAGGGVSIGTASRRSEGEKRILETARRGHLPD
jgi:hypothetical protein